MRAGELETDALQRETIEEIGLTDIKYKLVGRFIFNRFVKERQENHYFIVYEIVCDGKLSLGPEADSYRAFTEAELREMLKFHKEEFGGAYIAVVEKLYPQLLSA